MEQGNTYVFNRDRGDNKYRNRTDSLCLAISFLTETELTSSVHSRVGGGLPLPTMTHAPSLETSSMVRKIVAGPGG